MNPIDDDRGKLGLEQDLHLSVLSRGDDRPTDSQSNLVSYFQWSAHHTDSRKKDAEYKQERKLQKR